MAAQDHWGRCADCRNGRTARLLVVQNNAAHVWSPFQCANLFGLQARLVTCERQRHLPHVVFHKVTEADADAHLVTRGGDAE